MRLRPTPKHPAQNCTTVIFHPVTAIPATDYQNLRRRVFIGSLNDWGSRTSAIVHYGYNERYI